MIGPPGHGRRSGRQPVGGLLPGLGGICVLLAVCVSLVDGPPTLLAMPAGDDAPHGPIVVTGAVSPYGPMAVAGTFSPSEPILVAGADARRSPIGFSVADAPHAPIATTVAVPAQPAPTRRPYEPPPQAFLTIDDVVQEACIGTYCWSGGCRDTGGGWIAPVAPLVVRRSPFTGRLRVGAPIVPTTMRLSAHTFERQPTFRPEEPFAFWRLEWSRQVGPTYRLPPAIEQDLQLARPGGLYVLSVGVGWVGVGHAYYAFLVQVPE